MQGLPEVAWLLGSLSHGCRVLHRLSLHSVHVVGKVCNARVHGNEACNISGASAFDKCHTTVVPLACVPHMMNTKAVHHFPHYGIPLQSGLHSAWAVNLLEGLLLPAHVSLHSTNLSVSLLHVHNALASQPIVAFRVREVHAPNSPPPCALSSSNCTY